MVKLNSKPGELNTFIMALSTPPPNRKILDIGYFVDNDMKFIFLHLVENWREFPPMEELEDENAEQYFKR